MIDDPLQLQTLKFTLLVVGYGYIESPPDVDGAYPVTAVMSAFGVNWITSVVAVPVAETVTTVAHAAEEIADVPRAAVPLATTPGIVELAEGNVIVVESVPARVIELFAVRVFPLAIVNVADVAGAVIATLFTLVAVATPREGVVNEAFVMAVPDDNVAGRSPAAMARNAGAPAVAVANIAWVVVVDVAATTAVPVAAGRVIAVVPSAPVVGATVIVPLVALARIRFPGESPATPSVGAPVQVGLAEVAPFRTVPAAHEIPWIAAPAAPFTATELLRCSVVHRYVTGQGLGINCC